MGIKHLYKIEVVLKKSKYPISKTALANAIGMGPVLMGEHLKYFLRNKLVKRVKIGKITKYEWVRK